MNDKIDKPKIPSCKKDWQAIDIFLFSNGQQYSPPRKYHLRSEELNWWDATLGYLARSQYGSKHTLLNLYTLKGQAVKGPLELSNGVAYVAVLPEDSFINAGYEKYVIKASRSWEKRQSKISNILSEQTPETKEVKKDEAPRESCMLDATDTAKAIEEINVLEKPVVNAKSEENIRVILPNTHINSVKPVEKKRPNSHPIKRPIVQRRPTTSSPVSKLPLKRGVSPIKTTAAKSNEGNNINSAQTKPLSRPKTPPKPKKLQSYLVASRNITPPALVVEKAISKNIGQTTDILQVDYIDGKDIKIFSNIKKSDIPSSIVHADSISMNRTQNKEVNSVNVVSKETKNKQSDLPVIKELTNATSEKILFTPANTKVMSLDSSNKLSQIALVEHINNPTCNAWSNSTKQVPTSDDLSMHNKLISANEKLSSDKQQNPGTVNDNIEQPIANNDNINIIFAESEFRNFSELPDKSAKEPLMVLVNKGDMISLKLNLEVRNAEGVLNTVLNTDTAQIGAKNSHANNNSLVSIHDDGKSIHSNAGDDRLHPHVCCPGNTVVVRCACCNCYQYQTEASGNDSKSINNNDAQNYFVVVPVMYGNERLMNSSGIARFEKGNQYPSSLTKLNKTSIKEPFILATMKAQENRPEPAERIKIQESPNQKVNVSDVSRISFVTKNETTKQMSILPEVKARDSILVKRNISQTVRHVSEQHVPAMVFNPKKQLEHKATQSEWHNVLMELRRAEDGHYTFHLPSLSTLRRYNVPPFE